MHYLLQGLKLFSETSGLFVNPGKSGIYCAGMEKEVIDKIVQVSGFSHCRWPFTYLGVPISPKKLTKEDGRILLENMCARIKQLSSKNLSYAGRTMLVNSVLMTIQNYWSQIVILPGRIIKGFIGICRSFFMEKCRRRSGSWSYSMGETMQTEGGL